MVRDLTELVAGNNGSALRTELQPDHDDHVAVPVGNPFEDDSDSESALDFDSNKSESRLNQDFERISEGIARLEQGVAVVNKKIKQYDTTTEDLIEMNVKIQKEFSRLKIMSEDISDQLQVMKTEVYDTDPNQDTTLHQWKKNQLTGCIISYERVMDKMNAQFCLFRKFKEFRIHQVAAAMDVDLTEAQVDELIEDPKKQQQMVQQKIISDELIQNLIHLEETRDAMYDIEEGVKEILELWRDFNAMLSIQQEQIDSIEANVVETHVKVIKAREHLEKAQKHQECAKRNQCIAFICCAIILACLLGGVLGPLI